MPTTDQDLLDRRPETTVTNQEDLNKALKEAAHHLADDADPNALVLVRLRPDEPNTKYRAFMPDFRMAVSLDGPGSLTATGAGIAINKGTNDTGYLSAGGTVSAVTGSSSTRTYVTTRATAEAYEDSSVYAYQEASVYGCDASTTVLLGHATGDFIHRSRVQAFQQSSATLWGKATGIAYDDASLCCYQDAQGYVHGNARAVTSSDLPVYASDPSRVDTRTGTGVDGLSTEGDVGQFEPLARTLLSALDDINLTGYDEDQGVDWARVRDTLRWCLHTGAELHVGYDAIVGVFSKLFLRNEGAAAGPADNDVSLPSLYATILDRINVSLYKAPRKEGRYYPSPVHASLDASGRLLLGPAPTATHDAPGRPSPVTALNTPLTRLLPQGVAADVGEAVPFCNLAEAD